MSSLPGPMPGVSQPPPTPAITPGLGTYSRESDVSDKLRKMEMLLYRPSLLPGTPFYLVLGGDFNAGDGYDGYKCVSQVDNVHHGVHTDQSHPNILPSVFPCSNGSRKCIHDGYQITLGKVLDDLYSMQENCTGVWKSVSRNYDFLHYVLVDKFVNIVKGIFDALLHLLKRGKRIGRVTRDNVVFLANDPDHTRPLIIDCLVTGTGNDNDKPLVGFVSLADLIEVVFTRNDPHIFRQASPEIKSFVKCLRGAATPNRFPHLYGVLNGARRELMMQSHPFLLDFVQKSNYVCDVRYKFRINALNENLLVLTDVLGKSENQNVGRFGSVVGWEILFKNPPPHISSVMHDQWRRSFREDPGVPHYDTRFVTHLVRLFRDGTIHGGDSGLQIPKDAFGEAIDTICPILLSYLFELYGSF